MPRSRIAQDPGASDVVGRGTCDALRHRGGIKLSGERAVERRRVVDQRHALGAATRRDAACSGGSKFGVCYIWRPE